MKLTLVLFFSDLFRMCLRKAATTKCGALRLCDRDFLGGMNFFLAPRVKNLDPLLDKFTHLAQKGAQGFESDPEISVFYPFRAACILSARAATMHRHLSWCATLPLILTSESRKSRCIQILLCHCDNPSQTRDARCCAQLISEYV